MADRGDGGRRHRPALTALLALALGAFGLVAVGCGGDGGDEATEPTTTQTQTEDTTTTATEGQGGGGAGIDPAQGNPSAGQEVFAQNCSTCHGSTGSGAATGPSLQEPELADQPDEVVSQIVNGGGGMPPFGDQLSDQEIADVAAFVIEDVSQR